MGYGNVVAANSVLKNDFIEDNKLIVGKAHSGKTINYRPKPIQTFAVSWRIILSILQ